MTEFKRTVQKQDISEEYFGSLFSPIEENPFPGVVLLPGSENGIPEAIGKYIASHGYVVLALGYFGIKHLPSQLENIPLEYFQNAIQQFRKMPQVKEGPLTLMGYSRGGELTLLLGALLPRLVDALIAIVPNSNVSGGFPHPNGPAWLLNQKPILPSLHGVMSQEESLTEGEDLRLACAEGIIPYHSNTHHDPYEVVDLFMARQKHRDPMAIIPVERIGSPLLILSGDQDKIWPSWLYAEEIVARLDEKGSKIERRSVIYPNAGHGIISHYAGSIYHRVGEFWCTLGGTQEGNQAASKHAWQEIFHFLAQLT